MKCPFCGYLESKVIDSRPAEEGATIRRRRECLSCQKRFTTYEIIERMPLIVVKRDGSRQSFDKSKLINGMVRACEKRPVALAQLEKIADDIEQELQGSLEREINTSEIGEMVMGLFGITINVFYDKRTGKACQWCTNLPSRDTGIAPNLIDGSVAEARTEDGFVRYVNDFGNGRCELSGSHTAKDGARVEYEFALSRISLPSVVSIPFGSNRPLYSQKDFFHAAGRITVNGETLHSDGDTVAIVDDHRGYYPRHAHYDWVTAMLFKEDGTAAAPTDVAVGDILELTLDADGALTKIVIRSIPRMITSQGVRYLVASEYSADTELSGDTIKSTAAEENAVIVDDGAEVGFDSVTVSRANSDPAGDAALAAARNYGVGAALLTAEGKSYIRKSTVTTDAAGAAGLFSYSGGKIYAADTSVTTKQASSPGLGVTGGGKLYVFDMVPVWRASVKCGAVDG